MEIKTTLRFHPAPVRMATIKNTDDNLCFERMWGKGNTSALLVGMQTGPSLLDVSVEISQKIRKQPFSRPSNTTFGYIPKGCSTMPQGHVLNYVHSSIVCHSQNLETT